MKCLMFLLVLITIACASYSPKTEETYWVSPVTKTEVTFVENLSFHTGTWFSTPCKYKIKFSKPGQYCIEGWKYNYRGKDSVVQTVISRENSLEFIEEDRIDRLEICAVIEGNLLKDRLIIRRQGVFHNQ